MDQIYDYIICGAGAAGLSLAVRLCNPAFRDKRILILDQSLKKANDRTWCFWEKEESLFEEIIYKKWNYLDFFGPKGHIPLSIDPYEYKMIRGIDFYGYCKKIISEADHVQFFQANITDILSENGRCEVKTEGESYYSKLVFNSAIREKFDRSKANYVDQHFKGWVVQTEKNVFDESRAVFMDFRIDQEGEARFFYVLPTSSKRALIEVAIFSNDILEGNKYDQIIQSYINSYMDIGTFEVEEEEFGVIPMTSHRFKREMGPNIINIGTSGGAVKPSSGYAFKRIQEQTQEVTDLLQAGKYPLPKAPSKKFMFLDNILLNVVETNKCSSAEVFYRLFKKHKASFVFKFLDEKTNLFEDLKIVSAPPKIPFLKAAIEEIF